MPVAPSKERIALLSLQQPARSGTGDMWLCRRLGIVKVFTGHKNGQRRFPRPTSFSLYHWGKRSLVAHPMDWRDNDPNAYTRDPAIDRSGEQWEYLGNMFEMLPYERLSGAKATA